LSERVSLIKSRTLRTSAVRIRRYGYGIQMLFNVVHYVPTSKSRHKPDRFQCNVNH